MSMGFSAAKCKKALVACNNSNIDSAMDWLVSHMDDPDEDETAAVQPQTKKQAVAAPDEGLVDTLCMMGFTKERVLYALSQTDNDGDRAADWLLSHTEEEVPAKNENTSTSMTDAPAAPATAAAAEGGPEQPIEKYVGCTEYDLVSFVSHLGRTPDSGHYVTHAKKDGVWYLFNDNKVAVSADPPKDLGFIYFYVRKDQWE